MRKESPESALCNVSVVTSERRALWFFCSNRHYFFVLLTSRGREGTVISSHYNISKYRNHWSHEHSRILNI